VRRPPSQGRIDPVRQVRIAALVRGALLTPILLLCAGTGQACTAEQALILALGPPRDPAALQEAGDEFARTITRLSGLPIYDIDAFVDASDRDYEPVRDALKLMSLGPPVRTQAF
jgi:hypothetical protein